jgi:predicted nucleotidyltransferase
MVQLSWLTLKHRMDDPTLHSFLARISSVRSTIQAIYLFGSRAKGTERPDSDYDLLLVVSPEFTLKDKDALYDGVMDVLLETGRLVSLKIFREPEFRRLRELRTPFMRHVLTEGIQVG